MPFLFSYGSLQNETIQVSTFGRRLNGQRDTLLGYEVSYVKIESPQVAATLGRTHHANAAFTGHEGACISGTVFEISDAELARADAYEATDSYRGVSVVLASGREAWMYVYASTESGK